MPERPPLPSPGDDDAKTAAVVAAAAAAAAVGGGDGCWPSTPDEYKDQ